MSSSPQPRRQPAPATPPVGVAAHAANPPAVPTPPTAATPPTAPDVAPGAPPATPAGAPGAGPVPPAAPPASVRRIVRPDSGRIVGGVAAGVAMHLGVPVLWTRVVFAVMAALGGAGVLAYGLLWAMTPSGRGGVRVAGTSRERRQATGLAILGASLAALVYWAIGPSSLNWLVVPLLVIAVGAAFVWREADDSKRQRWRSGVGSIAANRGSLWRTIGGVALVIVGLVIVLLRGVNFTNAGPIVLSVVLTLVGVVVITVPWWMRLVRELGAERTERQRQAERAEIAAHLHDSVLQTLALIQRQPEDPRQVQRLARRQERELRNWLYGPGGLSVRGEAPGQTLVRVLTQSLAEVEDTYPITVSTVMVGDAPMNEHLYALAAAAREAVVNAAKHSGQDEVSVYAEVENDRATVYVRDRGVGFDPDSLPRDRRGLVESIQGRMERHGGTAVVRSTRGSGTEVELSVPVTDGRPAQEGAA